MQAVMGQGCGIVICPIGRVRLLPRHLDFCLADRPARTLPRLVDAIQLVAEIMPYPLPDVR